MLKSWEDWNKERTEYYQWKQRINIFLVKNGIACPKCGKELRDSDYLPQLRSTDGLPTKEVICIQESCRFVGTRIA